MKIKIAYSLTRLWNNLLKGCIFLFVYLLNSCTPALAQIDTAHGASLFQRCSACHKLDVRLVGPALGPQLTEETDDLYLTKWIQNNQALIAAKEPRAVSIYNRFNQSTMPAFQELSDKDVADIIGYVRSKWKNMQAAPKNLPVAQGGATTAPQDSGTIVVVAALILSLLCLIVILFMSRILRTMERALERHTAQNRQVL